MADAASQVADVWTPLKALHSLIESTLSFPKATLISQLEVALRRHKTDFFALLKFPGKRDSDRAQLRQHAGDSTLGATPGATPGTTSAAATLPRKIFDEACALSDLFNLNEYIALTLLKAAEQQITQYPFLGRGLVAVLLYYDGRNAQAHSLRMLLQARAGATWSLDLPSALTELCTGFTDRLLQEGMVRQVLELLSKMDPEQEMERLHQGLALGCARHRREVLDLFQLQRLRLAEAVFCAAAQAGLDSQDTVRLIDFLAQMHIKTDESIGSLGVLDSVQRTLVLALMSALDVSILQRHEESEETLRARRLPILTDPTFVPIIHRRLASLPPGQPEWKTPGLLALVRLVWSATLASLRTSSTSSLVVELGPEVLQATDSDESILDLAVDGGCFHFLWTSLLPSSGLHMEEFQLRRIHQMLTDFIVLMPVKVKEMRNRADEAARTALMYTQEGLQVPLNLPQHFEDLLQSLQALYCKDPLKLGLVMDFWEPVAESTTPNGTVEQAAMGGGSPLAPLQLRAQLRQAALFKFVRLAGDLLPPSLYVPYVRLLAALATHPRGARQAFILLRTNGAGCTVSWDHFFASMHRYLGNLRREVPFGADTVYWSSGVASGKGITPMEVEGLAAVLRLVTVVASQDESCRFMLCENLSWSPISLLLGLLCCGVPTALKADITYTLAGFARSADLAAAIWQGLEESQVLSTVMPPGGQGIARRRDLQMELEEVEARDETYPMTRAVLHLLLALSRHPPPATLGSGRRSPGMHPYVTYVRDVVLLKSLSRGYRDQGEMWEVAGLGLRFLCHLLEEYEPQPEDFKSRESPAHPGYYVMIHLVTDSPLLRLILLVVEEGAKSGSALGGGLHKRLERCVLAALQLLASGLRLENLFLVLQDPQCKPMLLAGLSSLLLSINPRSGKADYMLHIARFLTFPWLPHHGLCAATVLSAVARTAAADEQLLALFTSTKTVAVEIRHGAVESMEGEEEEDEDRIEDDGDEDRDVLPGTRPKHHIRENTKLSILELLQKCLPHPPPNLAHFFLGYDLRRPVATTLQNPGVMGSPHSVLHSLLSILDTGLTKSDKDLVALKSPSVPLAEKCAKVIHSLCTDSTTAMPLLRYLHSTGHLYRWLEALATSTSTVNLSGWILRCAAVETLASARSRQHSHLERLASLLLQGRPHQLPLLVLLETVDFTGPPEARGATWEYFDNARVLQLFDDCRYHHNRKGLIDIRKVHRVLFSEVSMLQSSAVSQRQMIMQEVRGILQMADEINKHRSGEVAVLHFLESWRQVTETMMVTMPSSIVPPEERVRILVDILQTLLRGMLLPQANPQLCSLASGTVLVLTRCLQETCLGLGEASRDVVSSAAAMHQLFSSIISWLLQSGGLPQRSRANLYCAALCLLRLANHDDTPVQREVCNEVARGYGETLIGVLCRDVASGHEITKMLALSILDSLASSGDPAWLQNLTSKGYLRHLLASLQEDDAVLSAPDEVVRRSCVFQSKLAFICRLALTPDGSQALLQNGLAQRLVELHCLDSEQPEGDNMCVPVLRLCHAILLGLGTIDKSAASMVLSFEMAHAETIVRMMREGSNEETTLCVGVLAQSLFPEAVLASEVNSEAKLGRLIRMALQILSRASGDDSLLVVCHTLMLALQMARIGKMQPGPPKPGMVMDASVGIECPGKVPGLSAVVLQVKNGINWLDSAGEELRLLQRHLTAVPSSSVAELAQIVAQEGGIDISSTTLAGEQGLAQARHKVLSSLQMKHNQCQRKERLARIILQASLALLWSQLLALAAEDRVRLQPEMRRSLQEAGLPKLQATHEAGQTGDGPFTAAMLQRVQRLLRQT